MYWYICINHFDTKKAYFVKAYDSRDARWRLDGSGWECLRVSGLGRRKEAIIPAEEVDTSKVKLRSIFYHSPEVDKRLRELGIK